MKKVVTYRLTLKNGRALYVNANNRVEAFDRLELLWPVLTKGYSFRDVTVV